MLLSPSTSRRCRRTRASNELGAVRTHMAQALVGRTVDLIADPSTIEHGVVTGVLAEAGVPLLLVGGRRYQLNQILTVTPTCLGA